MKAKLLSITLLITLVLGMLTAQPAYAQTPTETPTPSATLSPTVSLMQDTSTVIPPATSTTAPSSSFRPLIVLESYSVTGGSVTPGKEFELTLRVVNAGQDFARNLILTYSGGDMLPLNTGGVRSYEEVDSREAVNIVQPFVASSSLAGSSYASLTVNVSYTDLAGSTTYSESFAITIALNKPPSTGGVARPTATPTAVSRPQLVVSNYETDMDPLQPGSMFTLSLSVTNLGNADSRSVAMVLGGGTADNGTPGSGGVSGSGADLSTFAPLGSSNLVFLGDLAAGATKEISVPLVVNVTANPAAYAFKISFVFDDTKG
ncbi:MAG TPA: hypothetical protein VN364_12225, partial [Bellilinea sp.]|nr:hypothetical protein [Bellilinea sp.]